jgi:hypothetical protein
MQAPPRAAAWSHLDARRGFEVVTFGRTATGWEVEGCTAAVEAGTPWAVDYRISLDDAWRTRAAMVTSLSPLGRRALLLEADGQGRWRIDGRPASELDGCLDVDLESSAMTNCFPMRRLALPVGAYAGAPAAYARAPDLGVVRLEQTYRRMPDDGARRFDYASPAFGFTCVLVFDETGLVVDYPGIAARVA